MEMTVLRANLQRTGVYETKGPNNPPRIKWRFQIDKEISFPPTGVAVPSSPVLIDNWIYFVSTDNHLYALDLHTGQERWRFQFEWPTQMPAINDDMFYVQTRGVICPLERTTGRKRDEWSEHFVSGVMTIANGVLYIGNYDGLYAVELSTRKRMWLAKTKNSTGRPAFGKDTLYFGSFDHTLYAVAIDKGKIQWKFKTRWHIAHEPTVLGEDVYCCSEDRSVYALNAQTGKELWKFSAGEIVTALAVTDDIVCFGIWAGQIIALDRKSGQERWRFETEDEVLSSPSIAQGIVYFGDGDFREPGGRIYALDLQTGRELWRIETPNRIWSDSVIANGVLYVGGGDGCLYAIE